MGPCDRGNAPTHHGPFGGTCDQEIPPSWPIFGVHIWCTSPPTPSTCKACHLCRGQSTQHPPITPPLPPVCTICPTTHPVCRPSHTPATPAEAVFPVSVTPDPEHHLSPVPKPIYMGEGTTTNFGNLGINRPIWPSHLAILGLLFSPAWGGSFMRSLTTW